MDSLSFRLFANCFLVKGYSEGVLFDSQRQDFYQLPNDIIDFLIRVQKTPIEKFKKGVEIESGEIDACIKQFIDTELGFFTTEPNAFPPIDLTWKSPFKVTNAIIQINDRSTYDYAEVIRQLEKLDCQAFQLRIESKLPCSEIEKLIQTFKDTRVKFVELLMAFDTEVGVDTFKNWIKNEPRLRFVKLFAYHEDKVHQDDDAYYNYKILYFKKDLRINRKEVIHKDRFLKSFELFSEAQKHNTGLNRKVCITSLGEIKNYIEHEDSFGNVQEKSIVEVVSSDSFQRKWFIHNDLIEKCCDCQYRYFCTSNSDIQELNGKYVKTEMCAFDPYTNQWNHGLD